MQESTTQNGDTAWTSLTITANEITSSVLALLLVLLKRMEFRGSLQHWNAPLRGLISQQQPWLTPPYTAANGLIVVINMLATEHRRGTSPL